MIQLRAVTKTYPKNNYILKDINLHIRPKEFVCLVGKSGMGKTTLVKVLIAQEKIAQGRVIVGGWDITKIRRFEIPGLRRQIGVVFQDYHLLSQKTVYENVAFSLEVLGYSYRKIRKNVPQVLEIVGLEDKMKSYPFHLSGGEKQRVAIARSLVHRPKVLVADEPTGNLDAVNTAEVIDLLSKINNFGTTVMLITHDKNIVNSLRKRVITLENGVIVSDEEHGKYNVK